MGTFPIIDGLCPDHVDAMLAGGWWPFPGHLNTARELCPGCDTACWQAGDGIHRYLNFLGMPDDAHAHLRATHEAGHTLAGILGGARLTAVWINDTDLDVTLPGATTQFVDSRADLPALDWRTMVWAGEQATMAWLHFYGFTSPAHIIGARSSSAGDVAILHDQADVDGLPVEAGRAGACALVDDLWPTIVALADHLTDRRHLDGRDVLEFVHAHLTAAA